MSFEVAFGSNKEKFDKRVASELATLKLGRASKTIYLNGGSGTRADAREYWRQIASSLGVRFQAYGGCVVKLGG